MHKILIIEDELPARKKLKRYIAEVVSAYEIVAELETIEEALAFLSKAPELDLIFSDIELRDGNAFEIYNVITPECPIIFATAYNEFLVNAFEQLKNTKCTTVNDRASRTTQKQFNQLKNIQGTMGY